jgi:hypothetical protein
LLTSCIDKTENLSLEVDHSLVGDFAMMKYYQAKVNQSAKIICLRLEAANQVYDQIQKLEENPLYLNHNRIQDLTKEFQDQIDKPLIILNQIAEIKEDESYLNIEKYYF